MALRAGYYGVKRFLRDKLETIAETYDVTIKSLFPRSEQSVLGAKNLLENKATTQTVNGITYTVNSDGSITANGTATANADLIINQGFQIAEKCILSGCPANGSGSTYRLMYTSWGTPAVEYADTGNGIEINNIPIGTSPNVRVVFRVSNGKTVNITIKPMVRFVTDPDDTYAPYAMSNIELTNSAADQKTAINAIITAATGAADFAAFKTAMGAITPVTRSLSLTKEDITEEVKEAEPEKTVTKKRTTKKTEEV